MNTSTFWKIGRFLWIIMGYLVASGFSKKIGVTYTMIEPYGHQVIYPIASACFVIPIMGFFLGFILFPYIASIFSFGFFLIKQPNINKDLYSLLLLTMIGFITCSVFLYCYWHEWMINGLLLPIAIVTAGIFSAFDDLFSSEANETMMKVVYHFSSVFSFITLAILTFLMLSRNVLNPWEPSPEGWMLTAPIQLPIFWSTATPEDYMLFSAVSVTFISFLNSKRRLLLLLCSIFLFIILSIVSCNTKNLFFLLCGTIISHHVCALNTLSFTGSFEFDPIR